MISFVSTLDIYKYGFYGNSVHTVDLNTKSVSRVTTGVHLPDVVRLI